MQDINTVIENIVNRGAAVDQLGTLMARRAELGKQVEELKADLICAANPNGQRAFEGLLYRAVVSFADKRVTDWRAVVAFIAEQFSVPADDIEFAIRRHTETAEGVPCVRVSARKGV